jgi:hypothetical protein
VDKRPCVRSGCTQGDHRDDQVLSKGVTRCTRLASQRISRSLI